MKYVTLFLTITFCLSFLLYAVLICVWAPLAAVPSDGAIHLMHIGAILSTGLVIGWAVFLIGLYRKQEVLAKFAIHIRRATRFALIGIVLLICTYVLQVLQIVLPPEHEIALLIEWGRRSFSLLASACFTVFSAIFTLAYWRLSAEQQTDQWIVEPAPLRLKWTLLVAIFGGCLALCHTIVSMIMRKLDLSSETWTLHNQISFFAALVETLCSWQFLIALFVKLTKYCSRIRRDPSLLAMAVANETSLNDLIHSILRPTLWIARRIVLPVVPLIIMIATIAYFVGTDNPEKGVLIAQLNELSTNSEAATLIAYTTWFQTGLGSFLSFGILVAIGAFVSKRTLLIILTTLSLLGLLTMVTYWSYTAGAKNAYEEKMEY